MLGIAAYVGLLFAVVVFLSDLPLTFGRLLIEAGAPLPYVKDQLGHASIQITADTYIHLISGRNVGFIDRLDAKKAPQPSATQAQPDAEPDRKSL